MTYTRFRSLVDGTIFTGSNEFHETDTVRFPGHNSCSPRQTIAVLLLTTSKTTEFKIFIILIVFDELYIFRSVPPPIAVKYQLHRRRTPVVLFFKNNVTMELQRFCRRHFNRRTSSKISLSTVSARVHAYPYLNDNYNEMVHRCDSIKSKRKEYKTCSKVENVTGGFN